ncbi:MAG TPA: archease [Planctomycetota bacterium]|nr:archease [Planctomycetota bacterium]
MTTKPKYQVVEHTADVAIKVAADSLAELYACAGFGMFDLIVDLSVVKPLIEEHVSVEAGDYEELMVNWLNELLFLFETRKLLFCDFDIIELDKTHLSAVVRGEEFSPARHETRHDIKAVTYYGLHIEQEDDQWAASVVFDI